MRIVIACHAHGSVTRPPSQEAADTSESHAELSTLLGVAGGKPQVCLGAVVQRSWRSQLSCNKIVAVWLRGSPGARSAGSINGDDVRSSLGGGGRRGRRTGLAVSRKAVLLIEPTLTNEWAALPG